MLRKLSAWILFIGTTLVNLGLIWWFWIGYNLFIPHSGITYTGWAYWFWKLLLIQAILSSALFFTHLIISSKALFQGNILKARKISLVTILALIIQLILSRL